MRPLFYMNINRTRLFTIMALVLTVLIVPASGHARGVYQEPQAFLSEVFAGKPPDASMLWIKKDLKKKAHAILGHDLGVLRLHYWGCDGRTVWILDEIGKEQPITAGIVIDHGQIELVRVLVFRETRGWEIRYPFFTDQFKGVTLDSEYKLDKGIDGISGATLSVHALTKLARLALLLHRHSPFADKPRTIQK